VRRDFLSILLAARHDDGTPLAHDRIREEVDTFLFEVATFFTPVLRVCCLRVSIGTRHDCGWYGLDAV
jgi:hypothetical protein